MGDDIVQKHPRVGLHTGQIRLKKSPRVDRLERRHPRIHHAIQKRGRDIENHSKNHSEPHQRRRAKPHQPKKHKPKHRVAQENIPSKKELPVQKPEQREHRQAAALDPFPPRSAIPDDEIRAVSEEKRKNQEELPVNENLHRQLRIQVRLTPHLGCAERPVGKTKNVHQDDAQQGNAPQLIRHGFPPVRNLVWLGHQGFWHG